MKRILNLFCTTLICLSMNAQVSRSFMNYCPKASVDSLTKLLTVKWPNSDSRHIKERDGVWVSQIPTISAEASCLPKFVEGFVPFGWQLKEEDGQTVLHCNLRMPAEAVTNFWLASQESAIVDQETGTQYRAIRCLPEECWDKYFNIKSAEGDRLDFRIVFPKLPESVRKVRIYGVPTWTLRGENDIDLQPGERAHSLWDETPHLHKPTQTRQAKDYNKDKSGSWSAYTDAHLIRPLPEGTMALWRTPEATYLAIAHEQNWMREYYGVEKGSLLLDDNGHQYKIKELQDYPLGEIFWVEGFSGDCVVMMNVYEPIPTQVKSITYIEPAGEPFKVWGANWEGTVEHNLSVDALRANQKLFDYQPRQIVTQ